MSSHTNILKKNPKNNNFKDVRILKLSYILKILLKKNLDLSGKYIRAFTITWYRTSLVLNSSSPMTIGMSVVVSFHLFRASNNCFLSGESGP